MTTTPTENLVRARLAPVAATLTERASDVENHTERSLVGEFARFGEWTEIDSWYEGNFVEQIGPTAFDRAIGAWSEGRSGVKVLYDHGRDPSLGNKPLGPIVELSAGETGANYVVGLIDTDYNREFIIPAARAGLLGASFRFSVRAESWDNEPEPSDYNPRGLPERTITDVDLFEFGPVTFPAYQGTTVGLRSGTDEFIERLLHDPAFVARIAERTNGLVVAHMIEQAASNAPTPAVRPATATGADNVPTVRSITQRRALVRLSA